MIDKHETTWRVVVAVCNVFLAVVITSSTDFNPNLIWVPIMLANILMLATNKKGVNPYIGVYCFERDL